MAWFPTGIAIGAFPTGSMREVHVGNTSVLLVRIAEAVRAVEAICPHAGGILADGTLSGSRVVCPVHGATFDALTGKVLADPDGIEPPEGGVSALETYPTRVVDGLVEVGLPD
jgi:nitrite reductase/ring-hydroxylating ferredoxin subunit